MHLPHISTTKWLLCVQGARHKTPYPAPEELGHEKMMELFAMLNNLFRTNISL